MIIRTGASAPNFQIKDVQGTPIKLNNYLGKKVYISFLRNISCAMCSLHLFKITRVIDNLQAKGLEVIIFYESAKEMFNHSYFFREQILKKNKLKVISDPTRKIYKLFGAEISPQKATLQNFQAAPNRMKEYHEALQLGFTGNGIEKGTNPEAIPADFLLDEKLIIRNAHYGRDTGDFTSISVIESFAINANSI